jgi:hypothetical protein
MEAVRQNGMALQYVPENLKTESPNEFGALCLEAVKQDGRAIQFVPENLITASPNEFGAICMEAVKSKGFALTCLPENFITAELCLQAVKTVIRNFLEEVPESLRDEVTRALKNGE